MKLSIIIPVYNTESYLVRCLESVFHQDLASNEYEVIAINDGSTDASLEILKQFESKYKNLVVLTQENKGEAATRNRAIEISQGKYIAFVDSDDAIEPNTLNAIINRAEADALDILYLKMTLYDEEGNFLNEMPDIGSESKISSGFEHPRRAFPATLYLKSLIKDIKFDKDIIIGPDSVFNAMVQTRAQRCGSIFLPYYKYTFRLNSLSKQGHTDRVYSGFLKAINTLIEFEKSNFPNTNALQKTYFDTIISVFITRILQWNIMPNFDKSKFVELKAVLAENRLSYLNSSISKEFRFFDKSYFQFYLYHSLSKKGYKIVTVLSKVKSKMFPKN